MMSERIRQSITDSSGKNRRTTQSYQPVWMAHWMRTKDYDSANGVEASRSVKEPERFNTRIFKFANDSSKLSSKNEATVSAALTKHGRGTNKWNLELSKSGIVPYCYPLQKKFPNCVPNLETMRICTTVDSVEASPGGCPRFSQTTTHSLLITKNKDVIMSKESDICGTMGLITKMKGRPSPFFGQCSRGLTLQQLSSFSNSEETRNEVVKDSKVIIRNESSADTDTMDMDFFNQEKLNSGENSTPSTKGYNIDSNLSSPRINVSSSRRVGHRGTKTGLPNINQQLPALPAVTTSLENVGPTSSRTQSLEMETLLAHAELPNPKPNLFLDDSYEAEDPTNRWVKRLKLISTKPSYQGTKSSSLSEKSPHNKMKKHFTSILDSSSTTTTSEPIIPRKHNSIKKENSLKDEEKDKRLLLSHAWIKRWRKNGEELTGKKTETTVVICEPNSSKVSMDDLQQKQLFPSIAAMALMGKAMNGLKACEHQKRGHLTLWNTKAF